MVAAYDLEDVQEVKLVMDITVDAFLRICLQEMSEETLQGFGIGLGLLVQSLWIVEPELNVLGDRDGFGSFRTLA